MINETFINADTGEVLTGLQLKQELTAEEEARRIQQREYFKRQTEKAIVNSEVKSMMGDDFIQQQYINTVEVCLSDSGAFDSAFAFRLAYLTTYMDFNNILVFDSSSKKKSRFITEKDLKEVMGLAPKQLREFKKLCFEAGIIDPVEVEGIKALKVNKMVACKGNVPAYYKRNSIRVSVPHLQDIYKRATVREHKQLGYLTALLPYINYEYSVLCWNPTQEYKNYIEPLTIQDICKLIGYDITKASRLFRELRKTTLNGNYVFCVAGIGEKEAFFLNPKVYYKGTTPTGLKWLEELFELAEAWEENRKRRRRNKTEIKTLQDMVKEAKAMQ